MNGAERIAAERQRQIEAEGWTTKGDDKYVNGDLAMAGACYAVAATTDFYDDVVPLSWPWDAGWWKPGTDPIRRLEKAGALIAAEIDRLIRARS